MKKLFILLMLGLFTFQINTVFAQDADSAQVAETVSNTISDNDTSIDDATTDEEVNTGMGLLKKLFIDGGWFFMMFPLICLILGLAFCIERIITLNLLTSNPNKLLRRVESYLENGDIDGAREAARSSRGPVASIIYQGLSRTDQGLENVEKSVVNYGSVQMGRLEKNLVWIALFIALAPMLGFMGTVFGMIEAFDSIEAAGDISPGLVAGGIKVALITTLFGLVVAIILQIFYNYIVSKIDGIVNGMEDASISFVDLLIKHQK